MKIIRRRVRKRPDQYKALHNIRQVDKSVVERPRLRLCAAAETGIIRNHQMNTYQINLKSNCQTWATMLEIHAAAGWSEHLQARLPGLPPTTLSARIKKMGINRG
ncbi:MAG: hypothetical protein WBB19_12160 [Desulforhopalus sp.]